MVLQPTKYSQSGDRRNARFLVGDDSEEEEEDEKKDYFSDPESEESEDKSKWVEAFSESASTWSNIPALQKVKSTLS